MSGGHGKIRTRNSAVDGGDTEVEKKRKARVAAAEAAAEARKKARQSN